MTYHWWKWTVPIDPIPSHRHAQGFLPPEESDVDRSVREPWRSEPALGSMEPWHAP